MNLRRILITGLLLTLVSGCASLPNTLAQVNRSLDRLNAEFDEVRRQRLLDESPRWGVIEEVYVSQFYHRGRLVLQQELLVRIKGRPDTFIHVVPPPGPIYQQGTVYFFNDDNFVDDGRY